MQSVEEMHADARYYGIVAGLNIIAEALVAAKVVEAPALAALLQTKIAALRETGEPMEMEAANTLIHMLRPLTSEERNQQRALLTGEPQGQA